MYRGNRFYFHRLADGPTLARLDPYSEGEQTWPMNSGRTISVTAAEIRDITYQVHDIQLPEVNPELRTITDPTFGPRITELERLVAELALLIKKAPVVATPEPVIEAVPAPAPEPEPVLEAEPEPEPVVIEDAPAEPDLEPTFPAPDEKLSAYGETQDEDNLTTADLTEDVIQQLTQAKRKKWTQLLNIELSELQQERDGPRGSLAREAECERLLGLFAAVGEL